LALRRKELKQIYTSNDKMVFGYFEGSAVSQVHAEETVSLALKASPQSNGNTDKDTIQLHKLVESIVPPCTLHPMFFNGHLQTTMASGDTPVHYRRHVFESDHEVYSGQFTVDFVYHPKTEPPRDKALPPRTHNFTDAEWEEYTGNAEDDSPMLITMHGLSGGSHEEYVRHTILPLTKEGSGWTACVINARGCAWSKLTTPVLFNARATWDMRQLVKFLREKFPKKKMFAVGYSLGANILTNYLGEEGDKCELSAGIIVGNPWDLGVSNGILKSTWVGLNVYHAAMGSAVKKLFFRYV
jgi:predicted alpha/beta-fold hydrolase